MVLRNILLDTITPDALLIAKLQCYDIETGIQLLLLLLSLLLLLLDYPSNGKPRTNIRSSFCSWCNINTGVPEGSIYFCP